MRAIDALDRAAHATPETPFVVQGDVAVSYARAVAITHRIAARIQVMGVAPGTQRGGALIGVLGIIDAHGDGTDAGAVQACEALGKGIGLGINDEIDPALSI